MRAPACLGAAAFLLALVATRAPGQGDVEGFDPDKVERVPGGLTEEPWKEDEASFPPLPRPDDLFEFEVPESPFRHFLDLRSLSLGKDEVMRYTVVLVAGHARNILYEGLRCAKREFKPIGYATGTGGFRRRSGARWRSLAQSIAPTERFRLVLWDRYLCDETGNWMTVKEVLARLRDS